MKRLLIIASLLSIFSAFGESLEIPFKEEELPECFYKLICEMDKFEEIYDISTLAGPENFQKYTSSISQAFNMGEPVYTREFWILAKDTYCEYPEERRKKAFNDWGAFVGEHILEVCIDPVSEVCLKADAAADQLAAVFTKYKAMGACNDKSGVPEGMVPGGMGQMASPFG